MEIPARRGSGHSIEGGIPPLRRKAATRMGLPLARVVLFLTISILYALMPAAFLAAWRAAAPIQDLVWGCLLGLAMEAVGFVFFLFQAAAFIERLYRIPPRDARAFVLRTMFMPELEQPTGEVRNGDLTPTLRDSILARVGGPGVLIVHESNLVLLERGGAFTRLIGPGRHVLQRFERPALVLDLRPQARRRRVNAWTRDGLPVQTHLYLSSRLRWQPDDPKGEARLIRMAYQLDIGSRERGCGVDWAGELADEARTLLARRLARLWFDELWSPYPARWGTPAPPPRMVGEPPPDEGAREPPAHETWGIPERPPEDAPIPVDWETIRREIQEELEQSLRHRQWDIEILHFTFEPPVPWPEVEPMIRQAWLEHWQIPWRGWAVHLRSQALREQLRQRELARAMGQRELLEAIAAIVEQERPLEDPQRGFQRLLLRLAELVRHWAHPEAALLTPTDLLELFHHLQRMAQRPDSEGRSRVSGFPPPFPTDPGAE